MPTENTTHNIYYTTATTAWRPTVQAYDYVTREEMEYKMNKLVSIIKEHVHIDISEDDIMELLKE